VADGYNFEPLHRRRPDPEIPRERGRSNCKPWRLTHRAPNDRRHPSRSRPHPPAPTSCPPGPRPLPRARRSVHWSDARTPDAHSDAFVMQLHRCCRHAPRSANHVAPSARSAALPVAQHVTSAAPRRPSSATGRAAPGTGSAAYPTRSPSLHRPRARRTTRRPPRVTSGTSSRTFCPGPTLL
jgi:hypothetical protein